MTGKQFEVPPSHDIDKLGTKSLLMINDLLLTHCELIGYIQHLNNILDFQVFGSLALNWYRNRYCTTDNTS